MKNSASETYARIPLRRAVVTFTNSEAAVVGHVVELGKDGLSFLCKNCPAGKGELLEMDILIMDQDIFLPKVACNIVAIEPGTNPAGLCCGLFKRVDCAFHELNAEQAVKISRFYDLANRTRTTGNGSPRVCRALVSDVPN